MDGLKISAYVPFTPLNWLAIPNNGLWNPKKNIIFLCILRQLFGHSERRRWLIWIVPAQNHSLRVVLFIRRLSYCAHFRLSHVTPVLSFKRPYVYTFERPFVPFHRCFVFTPLTIRRHLAKFFPPLRSTQINCETFYFLFYFPHSTSCFWRRCSCAPITNIVRK